MYLCLFKTEATRHNEYKTFYTYSDYLLWLARRRGSFMYIRLYHIDSDNKLTYVNAENI